MEIIKHKTIIYLLSLTSLSITTFQLPAKQPTGQRKTHAQQLIDQMVARYPEVENVGMAVESGMGCATVAATDPKDIGTRCDEDEYSPMQTGEPNVEDPTKEDPIYDITQALHDSSGNLIGAVGMDLVPQPGQERDAVVAGALKILQDLEARIPSKSQLFEPASTP
ncbi:MAG: PDC sensor domain-containing protein [Calditrichota bacterium]